MTIRIYNFQVQVSRYIKKLQIHLNFQICGFLWKIKYDVVSGLLPDEIISSQ